MLLLPEVSKTFAESLPMGVREHAKILPVILRCISTKKARGESPSDLWMCIVAKEIRWSYKHRDKLTFRHRQNVSDLLEWYCSQGGKVDDAWLTLFPESEFYWRLARAELDWCAARVDKLSRRYRLYAIDLLADFCAANPNEFCPSWHVLNDADIPCC